ncbi:MAG TPA: DUF1800 domain-containing protein [Puia sp.]
MTVTNQLKNQHLMWRAGFGSMAEDLGQLQATSQKNLAKAIFKVSAKSPEYIDVASNYVKGLTMGIEDIVKLQKKDFSQDEKKQMRKQSQDDIKSLNLAWLNEMVNTDAQLREKMSLFWHGHFASRNLNIFYQQLLLDTIRKNALGNFADLLREVSKSAAMINFLNNNQNKKDHPNENFAREVMELFTMGRGNYSEEDVKEAARAFTGWGANLQGEFVFRKFQHDNGDKTFLGKTGNLDGDDVLNILLEQKQTANFITKKIYRFFVNDNIDESKVAWLGNRFYQNNYNIKSLMEDIFSSDWFYEEKNIGARIKSPVELIVGIRRMLPMEIENEDVLLIVQRLLGQLLFYPPNVAGWPGGANWIDSSTLMFRLRIPQIIYASDQFDLQPKDDDDQMMGMKEMNDGPMRIKGFGKINGGQMIKAQISWDKYLKKFDSVQKENLANEIATTILQVQNSVDENTLKKFTDNSSKEGFIKSATIQLMSTPEYQLC